jgi:hypothetical protein
VQLFLFVKQPAAGMVLIINKTIMKNFLTALLAVLIAATAVAQTETRVARTIKGKVINEATNEPLPYTNVGIEDTFYGTASSENGNFELKIPEEMVSRQILFSSVGYQSIRLPLSTLFNKEFNIIKLKPQTYDIEKVDIAGRSMVLARILRMASENTPYNFISGPFNLNCSLRREKTINDSVKVTEKAEVVIFDETGYRSPSKTNAYKMRNYTMKTEEPAYSFASGILHFDELLALDWVRNASSVLNPALTGQFELVLAGEPEIEGKPAWVISFRQETPTFAGSQDFHATAFEGEITIIKEDYSVKRIEGKGKSKMHSRQGKSLAVNSNNTLFYEDVNYSFTVTYSKMKPELLIMSKTYRYQDQQVEETTQLSVDNVQVENIREIARRDYFPE